MHLLNSKNIVEKIKLDIKNECNELGIMPGLATILVGSDPASSLYVKSKIKTCKEVGFKSLDFNFDDNCTTEQLIDTISKLNRNPIIHGILVQFPLPSHIDSIAVINSISPNKDVDCFHPFNLGMFFSGQSSFAPCTPTGVMTLLKSIPNYSLEGKDALIIGRSNLVGKPMAILLMEEHATVTLAHSRTKDLFMHSKKADIIIAATGIPNIITGDMVREGVVAIDVGITRILDPLTSKYKIQGDLDFNSVKEKSFAITPVPGGVGPMTIVSLLLNTMALAKQSKEK